MKSYPEQYCDALEVKNGTISINGRVLEDTVVTVTCLKPKTFILMGDKEVTCQSNGEWSTVPECKLCVAGKVANEENHLCGMLLH